ncbi:HNH endonuclease [Kroppenstedtia guangzhouensis]|nr:HNH endonuclease [Kroppenstedtia guangzhouensis]
MQLVDREVHAKAGHTGGREIWGGGEEAGKGKYRGE